MGFFKKIFRVAAPVVGNIIAPGIGGVVGGAVGGAVGGGGLKGALMGGLSGAVTGYAPQIGGAINNSLGLGLQSSTALAGLGGAVGGAGMGVLSGGGLKGALTGGLMGGAQGYLANGGLGEIGDKLGITGDGSLLGSFGTKTGETFGPDMAGSAAKYGPNMPTGSGLLGQIGQAGESIKSALNIGTGGGSSYGSGGSSMYNLGGALLGGANDYQATQKAKKALMTAQGNAMSVINPYLQSGTANNARLSQLLGVGGDPTAADYGTLAKPFTPGDLTQDPGYQFKLSQGTEALNRALAAKGGLNSGAALKAAQEYGQGLADQTYQDAYNRDLAYKQNLYNQYAGQSAAGQNAANTAGDIFTGTGNAKASATIASANNINQMLARLLTGRGAYDYGTIQNLLG